MSALAVADDLEPIVILETDAEVAALPALDAPARAYLTAQGIEPATWAAFRLGQVVEADLDRLLAPTQRRGLRPGGIWLPAFHPRAPETTAGLIRLTPAQHQHRFIAAPTGLAGPVDLDRHRRVVLCDNPLLTLRLHQAGVADAALVEDAAVLPPLTDWLVTREVVMLSTKSAGLAALRAALGERGAGVRGILIPAQFDHISDATRALLGIAPRAVVSTPTSPLSLALVRDLHDYSQRQLQTTAGMAALRAAELEHPDLVTAYRPGFLPEGYRDLLPEDQRQHFGPDWKGNALILPAYDERGVIVDLLACKPASKHVIHSLWPEPRGLLAPMLATAAERLVVTDTPRRLGRLSHGEVPALLLRGVADASANAARLAAGGVRAVEVHAHRDGDVIGAALAGAGLSVTVVRNPYGQHPASLAALRQARPVADAVGGSSEPASLPAVSAALVPDATPAVPPPSMPFAAVAPALAALPTLVLVNHDRAAERAVFRFGAGTYTVTVPSRPTSTLAISIAGPLRTQPMACDLAVEAARKRNAAMIACSTGLPGPEVAAALVALLPAVLALIEPVSPAVAPLNPATVPMRAAERDEAMGLLGASDLVERWAADLGCLGADAADPATTLALLAAISRLSDRPLWLALTATMPSERFPALPAIAQATPPDQVVHVTRLTAEALNHHDPEALRHKLLLLGDAAEISERAATSLRLFHDRGVLTTTTVERRTQYGGLRTRVAEVRGPIAVLAAATAALPHGLDHHLCSVPVDDSAAAQVRQRQAEIAPLADPVALAASQRRRVAVVRRLHNAQRLLVPRPVAIPDLASISLPAALARTRLHHDTLVGLIQASALLHQHQRPTVEGCVVATSADTDRAVHLLHHVAALQSGGLSRPAHRVLTALWAAKLTTFAMPDLHRLLGWERHVFRAALDELMRLDYVVAPRGVRGQFREYQLVAVAPDRPGVVRMPTAVAPALEVACG